MIPDTVLLPMPTWAAVHSKVSPPLYIKQAVTLIFSVIVGRNCAFWYVNFPCNLEANRRTLSFTYGTKLFIQFKLKTLVLLHIYWINSHCFFFCPRPQRVVLFADHRCHTVFIFKRHWCCCYYCLSRGAFYAGKSHICPPSRVCCPLTRIETVLA